MKKRITIAGLLLVVALGIVYSTRQKRSEASVQGLRQASGVSHPASQTKLLQSSQPSHSQGQKNTHNAASKLETPPKEGRLSVWFTDGIMVPEIADRYDLSALQIQQLRELRAELEIRSKQIDAENAVVDVSDDRLTVTVKVKANAEAAKKQSEFYQTELAKILGPVKLADLNKYLYVPTIDPVWNAGLLDKEIVIHKQSPIKPGDVPTYAIRAEQKIKTSPDGWPPAYDSATASASGSRELIARAYPAADLFMPKEM